MKDLTLHLVCVSARDGKVIFDQKLEPSLPESREVRDHGYAAPTPATDGKDIFVFFGNKNWILAFDPATGPAAWTTRGTRATRESLSTLAVEVSVVDHRRGNVGSGVRAPEEVRARDVPLPARGKVYVVTRRGGTLVLAAKPEFEQVALNKFESDRSTFNASPIVAHDRLYLRSDRYLYCIGKRG